MRRRNALGWLVVCACLPGGRVHAQSVLVPPVDYGARAPDVEQISENRVGSYAAPPLRQPSGGPEAYPLELGPARFHPHLGYQLIYGDGVLRGPNQPRTTVLNTVSPGVAAEIGRHWLFDASASVKRYSNAPLNDGTDYYLALSGRIPKEDWLFTLGYQGAITEQPRVESGTQTKQNSQSIGVSGTYHSASRISYETSLQQDALLTEGFVDSWDWSLREWVDYEATPHTTLGLGVRVAYLLADPGADSAYEQIQARWIWKPSQKLTFQLAGGVQLQHFFLTNSTTETGVFPLFSVVAGYQVFRPTSVSLSFGEEVSSSFLQGQFIEGTSFGATVQQKLFGHFSLIGQGSYSHQQYHLTDHGLASGRRDDYYSAYAALNTVLLKRVNLSVFYQFNENSSHDTSAALSFRSKQFGLQLSYRY